MPSFCIEPIRSCLCQADNHFIKFINSSGGQDTLAKFASEALFPIIIEGALAGGASDNTMKNIYIGQNALKTTRNITALLNVFRGSVPTAVGKAKEIAKLVTGYRTRNPVVLKESRELNFNNVESVTVNGIQRSRVNSARVRIRQKHTDIAFDRTEILLKIGEDVGTFGGAVTYAAGFGVCKTTSTVRTLFDLKFGPVGNSIADAFPVVMAGNHLFGLARYGCSLGYQFRAYHRAAQNLNFDMVQVNEDFKNAVIDDTIGLVEKVGEVFNDATIFIRSSATPWWVRLPLGVFINGCALLRSWRTTA